MSTDSRAPSTDPIFRDPTNGYAAFIDVDSFIDHHWLVEATKNVDGFRFSTFYYKDRADKIHMGPIWDWNLAFGNVNGKQGWMPQYWYWPNWTITSTPGSGGSFRTRISDKSSWTAGRSFAQMFSPHQTSSRALMNSLRC